VWWCLTSGANVLRTAMSILSQNPKTVRSRAWAARNPERWAALQRCYRMKRRRPCRECGGPIPFPSPGACYCSEPCRRAAYLTRARKFRGRRRDAFSAYKEGLGCQQCGYNTYGGSLDFHHEDGAVKERRISAGLWRSNTDLFCREVEKCVLLCKNCHYELHGDVF
jgi:hypothetical protein